MVKPLSTSSAINFCIASWHTEADLWFPLSAWNYKSIRLSSSEISVRGKDAPRWRICINLGQNGWWRNNSSKRSGDRNSDPNDNWLGCCRSIILFKSKLFSSSSLALNIAASELNLNINEGGFCFGDEVNCIILMISTKWCCVMVGLVLISVSNKIAKEENWGRGCT